MHSGYSARRTLSGLQVKFCCLATRLLKHMKDTGAGGTATWPVLRIPAIHDAKTTKNQTPLVRFALLPDLLSQSSENVPLLAAGLVWL